MSSDVELICVDNMEWEKYVILNFRRRYKVVAEQYCKISPLICMVCLFFKL